MRFRGSLQPHAFTFPHTVGRLPHTFQRPPRQNYCSHQKSIKICKVRRPPRSHISGFNVILVPHTAWQPPIRRRRFPCLVAFPIRFCGFPCDSAASHTQAISPYGIAVSPYGHTPDAFPHTFSQIPIGRPSPIRFPRIHHTIRKLQRFRLQIQRDQRSGPANPQPIQPQQIP